MCLIIVFDVFDVWMRNKKSDICPEKSGKKWIFTGVGKRMDISAVGKKKWIFRKWGKEIDGKR